MITPHSHLTSQPLQTRNLLPVSLSVSIWELHINRIKPHVALCARSFQGSVWSGHHFHVTELVSHCLGGQHTFAIDGDQAQFCPLCCDCSSINVHISGRHLFASPLVPRRGAVESSGTFTYRGTARWFSMVTVL